MVIPVLQPVSQAVPQSISQPVSQSVSRPVSQTISQPAPQSISQMISQTVTQPISQPTEPVESRTALQGKGEPGAETVESAVSSAQDRVSAPQDGVAQDKPRKDSQEAANAQSGAAGDVTSDSQESNPTGQNCAGSSQVASCIETSTAQTNGAVLSEIVPDTAASIGPNDAASDVSSDVGKSASAPKAKDQAAVNGVSAAVAGSTGKSASAPSGASLSTTAHDPAASSQATQKTQGDTVQPAQITVKPIDTYPAQSSTAVTQTGVRESSGADRAHAGEVLRESMPQTQDPEAAQLQGINTARVIQAMGETEMRVGLHSADFGDVSIRATISQQQMTAQISVDHINLGRAISAHIPAMEDKLGGETGLRALIEVSNSGTAFSGERGSSSQQQRSYAAPSGAQNTQPSTDVDHAIARNAIGAGDNNRLDVRV